MGGLGGSINALIGDLVQPTSEMARVIGAVAKGDLSKTMETDIEGRPLEGEFLRTAKTVNTMVDQLGAFASEVTRVAREVGTEGKLGGQAKVKGVAADRRVALIKSGIPQLRHDREREIVPIAAFVVGLKVLLPATIVPPSGRLLKTPAIGLLPVLLMTVKAVPTGSATPPTSFVERVVWLIVTEFAVKALAVPAALLRTNSNLPPVV